MRRRGLDGGPAAVARRTSDAGAGQLLRRPRREVRPRRPSSSSSCASTSCSTTARARASCCTRSPRTWAPASTSSCSSDGAATTATEAPTPSSGSPRSSAAPGRAPPPEPCLRGGHRAHGEYGRSKSGRSWSQTRPAPLTGRQRSISRPGFRTGDGDGAVPGTVCAVRGRSAERRRVTSGPVEDQLEWLCQAAVAVTEVSCCGVTMMTQGGQSVTAHASDERARAVEDLQHTLGEGPGVAASASGAAVLVPDLRNGHPDSLDRWPMFARDAVELGRPGRVRVPVAAGHVADRGASTSTAPRPGALSSQQLSQGLAAADSVAMTLAENGDGLPTRVDHTGPDAGTSSSRHGDGADRGADRPGAAADARRRVRRGPQRR